MIRQVIFGLMFAVFLAGFAFASIDITMVDVTVDDQKSTSSQQVAVFFTVENSNYYDRTVLVEAYLRPVVQYEYGLEIQGGQVITEMPSGSICVPANTRYVGSARVMIPARTRITGYLMPKVPPYDWRSQPDGKLRGCGRSGYACEYYPEVAVYPECGQAWHDVVSRKDKQIAEIPIQCSPEHWTGSPNTFGGGCEEIEDVITVDTTTSPNDPNDPEPDVPIEDPDTGETTVVPPSEKIDAEVLTISPIKVEGKPGEQIPIQFKIKNTGEVDQEFLVEAYLRKEKELMQIITQPAVPYSLCEPADTQFVAGMKIRLAPNEESDVLTLSPVMPHHPFYAGGVRRDSSSYKAQVAVYEGCGKPVLGSATSFPIISDTSMETSFAKGWAVVGAGFGLIVGFLLFPPYGGIIGLILGTIAFGLAGGYI